MYRFKVGDLVYSPYGDIPGLSNHNYNYVMSKPGRITSIIKHTYCYDNQGNEIPGYQVDWEIDDYSSWGMFDYNLELWGNSGSIL